ERMRLFGFSRWWRLFKEQRWPSREFHDFRQQTEALFRAIADVSGRAVVVDSSKSPLRAAWLTRMPGLDVRLLHLVRDARAVAWSRAKAYKADVQAGITREFLPKPAWISAGYWLWVNLISLWLRRVHKATSLELRYEDFVSQPAAAMNRIGAWSGFEVAATTRALLDGQPLHPEHTIAGNRLRMSGSVTLKPDWEWTDKLPRWDRAVCWLMTGWLLKRFGYSRRAVPPFNGSPKSLVLSRVAE
ncbi:MAG TPA: sulfotransferase, partial [Planctomycetaceae bacterium]|nr:sulfotransferase [Planctomycetaceae bacterium]